MFFRPSPDPEIATQPKTAEALQSVQAHRQYQDHVTPMDVAETTGKRMVITATTGAPTGRRGTRLKLSAGRKTVTWLPSLRRQSADICWRE